MARNLIAERNRRREFRDQLKNCDTVEQVLADNTYQDVLRVYGDSWAKLVWTAYSENFFWWGGADQKHRRLQAYSVPLLHALLGPSTNQYYLIPDSELTETKFNFGYQHKEGSCHWKIQANHGTPPNREQLEDYKDLCSILENK